MPGSGLVIFMPWVTLPVSVRVGAFTFSPINVRDPALAVGSDIAESVAQALGCYVGKDGKPIETCTIVLRARHSQPWNIPDKMWTGANRAAEMLALACLAEQRFFEGHLSPHLNATMFQLIAQGIAVGSDQIGLFYPRRGGGLRIGGLRFKDVVFQRPPQIEGTKCEIIGIRLLNALARVRRARHAVWTSITSSLELFLLAHAETQGLEHDTCVMLSAMAFERLLEPAKSSALSTAESFAKLWMPYARLKVVDAKRMKPDNNAKFAAEQKAWPVHRKWMKELYEARSSMAHRGPRSEFSQNWKQWQHLVIAAFTYPFVVKLKLSGAGFYHLSDKEMGACEALDELLDSHWGKGWKKPPEWSEILSMSEVVRVMKGDTQRAIEERSGSKRARSQARKRGQDRARPGYD
jgi:hypothetical protein